MHGEYDLTDQAGLFLLETALRAFDRMNQAGELVDKHGPAIMDRYQQLKANPAVAAERDARSAMLGAFRALNIDVVPVQKTGRLTGR